MNCDDARGRALDKKGDMIGEGHKGTTGLGHDKTSVMCSGRIWHAHSAPSTGQMGGSGGMRPTRFAGGKDRGFVAEPDEVRCDLSSHVLIGNAEVRAHAGFRSTGPAGEKRHRRAGHTAQKAATLDGHSGSWQPRAAE
jgi:hypothetical protein